MDSTYIAEGRVKLVYRHMAFLGMESIWAAEAADCAGEQGQFWAYHDKLYSEQAGRNRGAFSKDRLKRFASELGLDSQAFNACLDSDRYLARVQAETQAGQAKGVQATPTFFIDSQKIEGAPTFQQLSQVVEMVGRAPAPVR